MRKSPLGGHENGLNDMDVGGTTLTLEQLIEQCEQAWNAFVRGDPEPAKALYSHREDVALANPWGPAVRGWDRVSPTLDAAAARFQDGEITSVEVIAKFVSNELASVLEIERGQARVGGALELAPFALRVTTTYRNEDGDWKIVLRHADPIMSAKPANATFS